MAIKANYKKDKFELMDWILLIILTLGMLCILVPFFNVIAISFTSYKEYMQSDWVVWPKEPTLAAYQELFKDNQIFSVKISIPLENTGVSSVFATSVWPFSLIFSLARRNEGNFFQAVPTTLSSSLAEVRLASLVAWA